MRIPDASAHPWQDALTRRLRALIRTGPLHRLGTSKGQRSKSFADQDLRALALRVLDVVIEKMGLGAGATLEELRDALQPLVLASAPELRAEAGSIGEAVVLAMLNEPLRRQAFIEPYLLVSTRGVAPKQLQFHLLRERETADGETVVVATVEGINLYAGMLDYPVEDAQVAEEAVLQAQVQRGRIAEAVNTARRARLRSIEYEQVVLGFLETVRRDVQQVDWVDQAIEFLDQARQHLRERLKVEREIRRAVDDRLDASHDDAAELVDLSDTLEECIRRHARLHERLIGANRTYLAEQERQAFRPRAAERLPNLEADVLRRALELSTKELAGLTDALLTRFQAPRPPVAVRLTSLVDRLLAPRRAEQEAPFDLADRELETLPMALRNFDESIHSTVDAFFRNIEVSTRLSTLLARARDEGLTHSACHLIVLRVLRAFDPSAKRRDDLEVDWCRAPLRDERFFGDDLQVTRTGAESRV